MLAGERAEERLVHVVENLQCCAFAKRGVMIRVSGTFVVGTHFVPTGLINHFCGISEVARLRARCFVGTCRMSL